MNRRVLFVEDEDLLRTIYRRQTQGLFATDTVAGAQEALAALEGTEYAVVVTDRSLPDMDGLELALAVRRLAPESVLILLSANAERNPAGIPPELLFRVLTKPCPRELLLESLELAALHYESSAARPAAAPAG